MKEYLKGIIGSVILIMISIICLALSILVGPKKSSDFFEGFLKGIGYGRIIKNDFSFIDFDKIRRR